MNKHLIYALVACWVLSLPEAKAVNEPKDENRLSCSQVLQFPFSSAKRSVLNVLPPPLQGRPLSQGLRHIVDLAMNVAPKQVRGETVYLIEPEQFDASKLALDSIIQNEVLRIPEDILTTDELNSLRPQIQSLGFGKILDTPQSLPILKTYSIPQIRISGYTQILASTSEGYPVMLEHLPIRKMMDLKDRASALFVLSGLKLLSDKRVLPKLLGLTRTEDHSLMAVFPLPASYERSDVTMIRVGIDIASGRRSRGRPEPVEQENARIHPFEWLIERLAESKWPMQNFSLDLATLISSRSDLDVKIIVDLLKLPLWESYNPQSHEPFFHPNYFGGGDSSWLPALFSNPMATSRRNPLSVDTIEITALSTNQQLPWTDRVVHIPLQQIDPMSKYGRITLLRFLFFDSLLNAQSKVKYLDLLLEKAPNEQKALLDFVEEMAVPLKKELLAAFTANYRAKKRRESFQVIDRSVN